MYAGSEGPDQPAHPRIIVCVSLDTIERLNREQVLGWDFMHVQNDVILYLRLLKAIFSLYAAPLVKVPQMLLMCVNVTSS